MVRGACLALSFVWLTQYAPGTWRLIPELAAVCVLGALWFAGPRAAAVFLPALYALLCGGWIVDDRLSPELSGRDLLVAGTVCSFPDRADGLVRFELQPRPGAGRRLPRRILLTWYEARELPMAGQRWRLKVRLKRPRGFSNPGSFDFEKWTFTRDIGATGYVRPSNLNRRIAARVRACPLTSARQRFASLVEHALHGDDTLGYLLAITVGVRTGLSDADWRLLRRTGTVHLMAISGLHIGLVAGLMMWVGGRIGRIVVLVGGAGAPTDCGRALAALSAIGYSALAGFALPTVRALAMVLVAVALAGCRRRIPAEQTLAAAAFVVLLVQPTGPLSAGFWLSFYAVALLIFSGLTLRTFASGYQTRLRRPNGRLHELIRAQFALSIGLAPLTILFFQEISLVSFIANLFALPVFTLLIVPLSLAGTLSSLLVPGIGAGLLQVAAWVMQWVLRGLGWLEDLPIAAVGFAAPTTAWTVTAVAASLLIIWPRPCRGRMLAVIAVVHLAGGARLDPPEVLRVVVMDVGQGSAVLIQTAGHALVYDTGPAFRTRNAGDTVVVPYLRELGIRQLDAVVISHADSDHAGGVSSVLAAYPDTPVFAPVAPAGLARLHKPCVSGLRWRWDGVEFSVVHPKPDRKTAGSSKNNQSCVLVVDAERQRIVLPGDIEQRAEYAVANHSGIADATLVLAPHHGSSTSSSQRFVDRTRPEFVVFSVGHRNRWGFPKPDVVARWSETGACLLTTAVSGALVFSLDRGGSLILDRQYRLDSRYRWTEKSADLVSGCGHTSD